MMEFDYLPKSHSWQVVELGFVLTCVTRKTGCLITLLN